MGTQNIDFTKSPDTGDATTASIQPLADAEPATAAVFQRPSEALRNRTEVLRAGVEDLNYLADFDRVMTLEGGQVISWSSAVGGKFVTTDNLRLRPFLSPLSSLPATLATLPSTVLGDTTPQFTFSTRSTAYLGLMPLRAYGRLNDTIAGANKYSFEIVQQTGAALALTLGPTDDPRHYVLTVDNHTVSQVETYLIGSSTIQEFRNRFTITVTPANKTQPVRVLPRTFFKGAVDAEVHEIPPSAFAAFFTDTNNYMLQGDVLAISYDGLWAQNGGGRKQSIADSAVENNAVLTQNSLFIVRKNPEKMPHSIPVAARVLDADGEYMLFANGKKVFSDAPGYSLPQLGTLTGGATAQFIIHDPVQVEDYVKLAAPGGQGTLTLSDGVNPVAALSYTAAATLLNGGDGNAYHTHTPLLQRWRSATPGKAISTAGGTVMTGVSPTFTDTPFHFATSVNNQIVELSYNILMGLSSASAVTVSVWLNGVHINAGDTVDLVTDVYDANNPDIPNYTLNGSWWVTVPTKATDNTLQIKVTPSAGTLTLDADSRITLS
jgi:hypothetical protein